MATNPRPSVLVFQQVKNPSAVLNEPKQPTIIVGPMYNIVSGSAADVTAFSSTTSGVQNFSYPGTVAGQQSALDIETGVAVTHASVSTGNGGTVITVNNPILRLKGAATSSLTWANSSAGFTGTECSTADGSITGAKLSSDTSGRTLIIAPSSSTGCNFTGVSVGDDVNMFFAGSGLTTSSITGVVNTTISTVNAVGDANTSGSITLASPLPADFVEFNVLQRKSGTFGSTDGLRHTAVATSGGPPVDSKFQFNFNSSFLLAGRIVESGTLRFNYRALRTDVASSPATISDINTIESNLGKIHKQNPLALATSMALANTNTSIMALGLNSDDTTGHSTARDVLEGQDVSFVVPLTNTQSIITSYKTHAENMSTPGKGKWRIILASLPMACSTSGASISANDVRYDNSAGTLTISGGSTTWANSGPSSGAVQAGDYIYFPSGAASTSNESATASFYMKVNSLTSSTVVNVASTMYTHNTTNCRFSSLGAIATSVSANGFGDPGGVATARPVQVIREKSRGTQVDDLVAAATGYSSRRITLIHPDSVLVTVNGSDETLGGHYLAAACGGLLAGIPSHQSLTNLSIGGIKKLNKSNTYLNDDQIDKLIEKGVSVVMQESEISSPYTVRSITTDISTLEYYEMMVVKNLDFISKFYKNELTPIVGRYNVVPEAIDVVRVECQSILDHLKSQTLPKIGPPILDGSITEIKVDDSLKDQLNVIMSLDIPRVLNRIRVDLVI